MGDPGGTGVERIVLDGEYDLSRKDELRAELARLDGSCPIELDFRALDYADSSFFHILAELRKTHPDCGITISGASPMIRKLLNVLDFAKLFTIE